jgi:integrase/recombinase XerD
MTDRMTEFLINEFTVNENLKGLKSETVKRKVNNIEKLVQYLKESPENLTLLSLTEEKLKEYLNILKGRISAKEYNGRLSNIRMFYQYLKDEEVLLINPALMINCEKVIDEKHLGLFTEDEVRAILKVIPEIYAGIRDRAILELLYSTGIRAMELCFLETEDVDFDEKVLFIRNGKGSRERYIPFGESARYWLQRYIEKVKPLLGCEKGNLLFCTLRGTPLTPDSLLSMVKKRAKASGIEKNITTHTFRHSCATHMLKGRADIRYVQLQLGHRSIGTTEKYLKIEISDLKEVHGRCHPRERDE